VPAPDQAGRVLGSGRVEGLRGGRAPVDELGLLLVVAQADPPDVQGGAEFAARGRVRVSIGAAEAQAVLDRVQLGQPPGLFRRRDVPLDPGLEGPS
jgi:hypothetical protein